MAASNIDMRTSLENIDFYPIVHWLTLCAILWNEKMCVAVTGCFSFRARRDGVIGKAQTTYAARRMASTVVARRR
jgi:hypothetical protein